MPEDKIRLPPVTVPDDDQYLPSDDFPRRGSITDPFLHAYTAQEPAPSTDLFTIPSALPRRGRASTSYSPSDVSPALTRTAAGAGSRPESPVGGDNRVGVRGDGMRGGVVGQRYSDSAGPASPGYSFGSSLGGSQGGGFAPPPPSGYRFGSISSGPSSAGAPTGGGGQSDGPFFDYSMRRHSLTNSGLPTSNRDSPASTPGLKRKTSGEESIDNEEFTPYPPPNYVSAMSSNGVPYPKRRGSALAFDKLGSLTLEEQQARRDSAMSAGTTGSWEDERRGGYPPVGAPLGGQSRGYGGMNYAPGGENHDLRGVHQQHPNYGQPPPQVQQRLSNEQLYYQEQQQQQQHGRGQSMDSEMSASYGGGEGSRRSSQGHIQSMQYANYSNSRGVPPQHSNGSLASVAQSPPEEDHSRSVDPSPLPPAHQQWSSVPNQHPRTSLSASYSNLPSAQAAWARAGPLPPSAHGQPRRGSGGPSSLSPSLDPGYGAGSKDTPYSRSPELRVSHKLAERKRRKEMAQLFDELRDSLPADRGMKSSKWEILSKAVDYIGSLKEHNQDLLRDNTLLRTHFGLGPGPQSSSSTGGAGIPGVSPPPPPSSSSSLHPPGSADSNPNSTNNHSNQPHPHPQNQNQNQRPNQPHPNQNQNQNFQHTLTPPIPTHSHSNELSSSNSNSNGNGNGNNGLRRPVIKTSDSARSIGSVNSSIGSAGGAGTGMNTPYGLASGEVGDEEQEDEGGEGEGEGEEEEEDEGRDDGERQDERERAGDEWQLQHEHEQGRSTAESMTMEQNEQAGLMEHENDQRGLDE